MYGLDSVQAAKTLKLLGTVHCSSNNKNNEA